MHEVLANPFGFASVVLALFGMVCIMSHYWWKTRQAEIDAGLKHEMLKRGLGAREILEVLHASTANARPATPAPEGAAAEPESPLLRIELRRDFGDRMREALHRAFRNG